MQNETIQGANRAAMRAVREALAGPPIRRGAFILDGSYQPRQFQDGARWTFSIVNGPWRLTYHDAEVISVYPDELNVFVGPSDVVTWEPV